MATNPRAKTPNDAALSAVEEALRLDFGGPGDDGERATKRPPEPRAPEGSRATAAADAARRSELQRRPETPRMPAPPRRIEQQAKRVEEPPPRRAPAEEPPRQEAPRQEARRPEPRPDPE